MLWEKKAGFHVNWHPISGFQISPADGVMACLARAMVPDSGTEFSESGAQIELY